jgi:hypothetical protein
MRLKSPAPTRETAETLALQALGWLAADDGRLARFLNLTGIDPQHLRQRLSDPATLAGILDFLLADEPMLLDFCAGEGIDPQVLATARRLLPGWQED